MGPQEEFYGCADISIMESPESTSGSRESPLKPFEPLEIQFQQTLQNFRSISMDEVPYSEDQKTYSTDNYQTSIVTSAYPEVITRSSVTENSVSASRNLSESTEILPSLLAAKETKYQTPSSFIKPVTLKSVINSLLESDRSLSEIHYHSKMFINYFRIFFGFFFSKVSAWVAFATKIVNNSMY